MNKRAIRKWALDKRSSLTAVEANSKMEAIANLFFKKISLEGVKYLHSFLPIAQQHEPNTLLILKKILNKFPDISIAAPRSDFETGTMRHFIFDTTTRIEINRYGIPEPEQAREVATSMLDMVLVPLLAFDKLGNRVGYGKGFYDRFLADCRRDCIKIGISFCDPVDKIDTDTFDVKLDYCITPEKIYRF